MGDDKKKTTKDMNTEENEDPKVMSNQNLMEEDLEDYEDQETPTGTLGGIAEYDYDIEEEVLVTPGPRAKTTPQEMEEDMEDEEV